MNGESTRGLVLLVDPDERIARGVKKSLKGLADVTWARTIGEGLEAIAREQWDVVITERYEEVVRFVRAIDQVASVLVYTRERRARDRRLFKQLRVAVLEKPKNVRRHVKRGLRVPLAWRNQRRRAFATFAEMVGLRGSATNVFRFEIDGLYPREIASRLGRSLNTVYGCNEEIARKVAVRTARDAAERFNRRVRLIG